MGGPSGQQGGNSRDSRKKANKILLSRKKN